jgi:hypothetical protein
LTSGEIIHYGKDGQMQWTQNTAGKGSAITLDSADDILTIGDDGQHHRSVTKFLANGTQAWTRIYCKDGYGACYSITADSANNVYVSGYTFGGANFAYQYTTVKYDPSGQQLWVQNYNRYFVLQEQGLDPNHVAVDSAGNLVVAGCTGVGNVPGSSEWYEYDLEYLLLKYDPDGNLLWEQTYHSSKQSQDEISCLALDSEDNIYVSGSTTVSRRVGQFSEYISSSLTAKFFP